MKHYSDIAADGGSGVEAQIMEQARRLEARVGSVRHIVAVMSGKGGVGKSSLTVNLAAALALEGHEVGILDADLNGPSIAMMTGVRGQRVQTGTSGIRPAVSAAGLKVMSMDLFLPDDATPVLWDAPTQKDAYAWRGLMEAAALREFLSDTEWGTLDFLLIDLPPGTDRLPMLVDVLPQLSGALAVTIPSAVSTLVVGRSLTMARELLKAPIIGVVENMAFLVCPACGNEVALYEAGSAEAMADVYGVPVLGSLPFEPRIAASADEGVPFVSLYPDSPSGQVIRRIAAKCMAILNHRPVRLYIPINDGERT